MRMADDARNELVRQWLDKADADIRASEYLLPQVAFSEIICFHAQQCAEKLLKSLLAHKEIEIAKTHNLKHLLDMTGLSVADIGVEVRDIRKLSSYSVDARYPVGSPMPGIEDAKEAIEIAKRIRDAVLKGIGE